MAMLDKVKVACRVTSSAFNDELTDLIAAAYLDLGIAGVVHDDLAGETDEADMDALIKRAVITYCRANFGNPDNYDKLKASYDEQKAQLSMATGYTDWETDDDE